MSEWKVSVATEFDGAEVRELYDSVGWSAYTDDAEQLLRGLECSTRVVVGRAQGELVGLARVISDSNTIVYLQDVLVHPNYQRSGLGCTLIAEVLAPFENVRQTVLLTDDEMGQRAFYESLGFTEIRDFDDFELRAFVKFAD